MFYLCFILLNLVFASEINPHIQRVDDYSWKAWLETKNSVEIVEVLLDGKTVFRKGKSLEKPIQNDNIKVYKNTVYFEDKRKLDMAAIQIQAHVNKSEKVEKFDIIYKNTDEFNDDTHIYMIIVVSSLLIIFILWHFLCFRVKNPKESFYYDPVSAKTKESWINTVGRQHGIIK